jgi:hypothetical protein
MLMADALRCLQIAEGALMPKRRSFVWSPSQAQLDVGDVVSPPKATPSETVVMRVESFGMKLAHQFPWNPAASVAVGLALRRRFLSDPNMPSTYIRRKQIIKVLAFSASQGKAINFHVGFDALFINLFLSGHAVIVFIWQAFGF